jgi:hypothetical protein
MKSEQTENKIILLTITKCNIHYYNKNKKILTFENLYQFGRVERTDGKFAAR